jgi:hypothetical protein
MAKLDLSCGGRLTVNPHVSERSVLRMADMVEGIRMGGHAGDRARADFKETLSTSDAPYSFAQLMNIRNLPLYDEAPVQWSEIASTELVSDFRPQTFYNLRSNFDNLGHGNDTDGNVVAPLVPELGTYVEAYGYKEEAVQAAIQKRGFKWGISLERVVNDPVRAYSQVPNDMLNVGVKTDEFVVFRALVDGAVAGSQMTGGDDLITGDTIPANAPFSAAAVRVALRNIAERTDSDGNRIPVAPRYRVVVPLGEGDTVQWMLDEASRIIRIQDGVVTYGAPGSGGLNRIAGVIESEFIPADSWYLVPDAGTTRRPSLVRLQLTGYTAPEVYVEGTPVPVLGGASSDPFRAFSWDDDSARFKFRMFTNAALISQDQLVWSDGSGS